MPGPQPPPIVLTERQRAILERVLRRQTSPQRLIRRVRLILEMARGANNGQAARRLAHTRKVATSWRRRWGDAAATLAAAEAEENPDKTLEAVIAAVLADRPRPGAPDMFTPEQIVQIIAMACEDPVASGRPTSHWTAGELAAEAVKRGVVAAISPRSVARFLARRR